MGDYIAKMQSFFLTQKYFGIFSPFRHEKVHLTLFNADIKFIYRSFQE